MADPMYRQIAESLRRKIESGEIAPGVQLRTEAELRQHYDTSRNTIRDAIKWLISLGLVETRPGQGTFVVTKVDPFITTLSADTGTGLGGGEGATYLSQVTQQDREASSTVPQVEMQTATGEVGVGLQLEDGALVISRTRSAISTRRLGLCRPPTTREGLPSRAPTVSSNPPTSPRGPFST